MNARDAHYVFDLGNTRLKFAPLRDGALGTVDAIDGDLREDASLPNGDVAYVAMVAPEDRRARLIDALAQRFTRIAIVRTPARHAGLRIAYAAPARLGADRFLAMLAARAQGNGAWLVAGVGTALTIDLVDAAGQHRGGRIAPSPSLMRDTLASRAPALPRMGGDYVEFADDTADALASGCEGAAVALVERSLQHAAALLGAPPALLLHGGGADTLRGHFAQSLHVPYAVLQGLSLWAGVEHAGGRLA